MTCKCILYGFELKKPCSLCKCKYHISKEAYMNCLENFLISKEKSDEPLRLCEISSILETPKAIIENKIKNALDSIKIDKLDKTIDVGNELEFVENSHRCVCCSKKAEIEVSKELSTLHYCSEQCKKVMPPKLVYLIKRLGVDARTILVAAVRCLSGKSFMDLLEISEDDLKFLYEYYFGIKIHKILNDNVEMDLNYKDFKYHYYKLPNSKSFIYADDEIVKNNVVSCFC